MEGIDGGASRTRTKEDYGALHIVLYPGERKGFSWMTLMMMMMLSKNHSNMITVSSSTSPEVFVGGRNNDG